jgi:hypothetical protein
LDSGAENHAGTSNAGGASSAAPSDHRRAASGSNAGVVMLTSTSVEPSALLCTALRASDDLDQLPGTGSTTMPFSNCRPRTAATCRSGKAACAASAMNSVAKRQREHGRPSSRDHGGNDRPTGRDIACKSPASA